MGEIIAAGVTIRELNSDQLQQKSTILTSAEQQIAGIVNTGESPVRGFREIAAAFKETDFSLFEIGEMVGGNPGLDVNDGARIALEAFRASLPAERYAQATRHINNALIRRGANPVSLPPVPETLAPAIADREAQIAQIDELLERQTRAGQMMDSIEAGINSGFDTAEARVKAAEEARRSQLEGGTPAEPNLAEIYRRDLQRRPEALAENIQRLEVLTERNPNDHELRGVLRESYIQAGRFDDAARVHNMIPSTASAEAALARVENKTSFTDILDRAKQFELQHPGEEIQKDPALKQQVEEIIRDLSRLSDTANLSQIDPKILSGLSPSVAVWFLALVRDLGQRAPDNWQQVLQGARTQAPNKINDQNLDIYSKKRQQEKPQPNPSTEIAAPVEKRAELIIIDDLTKAVAIRDEIFRLPPSHPERLDRLIANEDQIDALQVRLSKALGLEREESFEIAYDAEKQAHGVLRMDIAQQLREAAQKDPAAYAETLAQLRAIFEGVTTIADSGSTPEVKVALEKLLTETNQLSWLPKGPSLVSAFYVELEKAAAVSDYDSNGFSDLRLDYQEAQKDFRDQVRKMTDAGEGLNGLVDQFKRKNGLQLRYFQALYNRRIVVADYERFLAKKVNRVIGYPPKK